MEQRKKIGQRGAALVEAALVLPLLLLVLFGGLAIMTVMLDKAELTYGTQTAAQAAATVLLTKDPTDNAIIRDESRATTLAMEIFSVNAPTGATLTLTFNGSLIDATGAFGKNYSTMSIVPIGWLDLRATVRTVAAVN